ncbi:MAG: NAD(P)-binding protein [Capsulimonadales bacterium]|nr:NAD(P)-binding protein [Capsulimonadales bacterium]
MTMTNEPDDITDFLVIGAGLAGLAFASEARTQGATVRVLDKGRGVGGRMATRRLETAGTEVRVDHGAQFFTARETRLSAWAQAGLAEGWLSVWTHGFPLWKDGTIHRREEGHPRYAPRNGMNELARRLGAGLTIERSTEVRSVTEENGVFVATAAAGERYRGRNLILNAPPVQVRNMARNLLSEETVRTLESVEFLPAWTWMAVLSEDVPGADWPALEMEHPVLGWVSRDHTKREPGGPPTLVAHGSGAWSREHSEDAPETVLRHLTDALRDTIGDVRFETVQVHRWRYAQPIRPLTVPFLREGAHGPACCGDWCGGPRVEGALESGWKLAEDFFCEKPSLSGNKA